MLAVVGNVVVGLCTVALFAATISTRRGQTAKRKPVEPTDRTP